MEKGKSPWSLSPEDEAKVAAIRAERAAEEREANALEQMTVDLQSQLDAFIAEKQLVVQTRAVEGGYTIATAENNTFDRLGEKAEELIGLMNLLLESQGINAYYVLDRFTDKRTLSIRSVK